ncbi:type II toxin-antitoxin system death-on-curing family toxin [Modestobacter sp. SYSU DS0290]
MAGLTVEDLLHVARRCLGGEVQVRDLGLLTAALARMDAVAFEREVYPSVREKAAALMHSLATTAPLVEGNRPFALSATLVYLALNGQASTLTDDEAVAVVTGIMTGRMETVQQIATALGAGSR